MPGVLKNLLDQTPVEALKGKATAIVATGATAHHFLGVDRHLRDVLAFFGALVTPVSVYLMSNTDFVEGRAIPAAAADLDTGLQAVVELARLTEGRELGGPRPVPVR
jgi:FMN reductase